MSAIRGLFARFLSVFRSSALDREFDDEAQSHLDLATEEFVQRGMPLAEAQRLARVKFGSTSVSKDLHRDSRGLAWLEGILHDAWLALRGLRRDPAFTVTALLMLTLAIGLNVTVFAVMEAMLFRGYPLVKGNDRLVYVQERSPSGRCCISYADFEDWRAQARTFEGMAFVGERFVPLQQGEGRPIDTAVFTVSVNTFGLLGVSPMLGRDFTPADEGPGATPVAILTFRCWVSKFGRKADIVGTTVRINGAPATIIGVMPERFEFPTQFDLWMPLAHTPQMRQRGLTPEGYIAVGRLRAGVGLQQVRAELDTINRRLAADYPVTNRDVVPTVSTHSQMTSGPDAPVIWGSLWAGAWLVWLIACANVANLTLVRTLGRWREFSTRMALGAGQGRMIRHVLMESLLLAGVAGALGWLISEWSVQRWAAATASPYQILEYTTDARRLVYAIAISVAPAIVVSLAPIGRVLQLGVTAGLKGDARGVTRGRRGTHLSAGLVAAQVALAVVLLAGAGVLVRSFAKIVSAETGVRDPEDVLVGWTRLPPDKYPNPVARLAYFDRLAAQLKVIPGVEAASLASIFPVRYANRRSFEIDGRSNPPEGGESSQFLTVGSDYFRLLGASAVAGRDFNDGDHSATLPVAIVNQSFASTFWQGKRLLGKRLRSSDRNAPGPWRIVVGIVPNIMQGDATRQSFGPVIYVPFRQQPLPGAFFFVRTRVPPSQVAHAVLAEAQKIDQDVPVEDFTTLKAQFAFHRDYMDAEHSELGKYAAVAPVFATIALVLAAIGLAAVVAHSVTQRTKEIGVRMAIGASVRDIRRMILREGMTPVAVGMLLGLAASLAVNRVLRSQLVGVSPYDLITMTGAPVLLVMVVLVASLIPARRAMRVDPVVALRHE